MRSLEHEYMHISLIFLTICFKVGTLFCVLFTLSVFVQTLRKEVIRLRRCPFYICSAGKEHERHRKFDA